MLSFCFNAQAQDMDAVHQFMINPERSNLKEEIANQEPETLHEAFTKHKQLKMLNNYSSLLKQKEREMLPRYDRLIENSYPELYEEWEETLYEYRNNKIVGAYLFLDRHPEVKMPIERATEFTAKYNPRGGFDHDEMVRDMMEADPEAAKAYMEQVKARRRMRRRR